MIFVDLNQLMMISLHASYSRSLGDGTFNEGVIRHLTLNLIRTQRSRFGREYGRIVICCDGKGSWRKEVYPFYKAHRKTDRVKQTHIEWDKVFALFASIKDELREYSNYPVVEVARAEGDDVIAALAMRYRDEHNIIISADRDFMQLQAYLDIAQYDPVANRMLRSDDPRRYLEEHLLEGDRGDGVPNVLSDDDTFVTPGKRQGTLTKKRVEEFLSTAVSNWENKKFQENWKRNRTLIDLRSMPTEIAREIVRTFEAEVARDQPRRFYEYFVKYKLSNLLDSVSEF